MLWEEPHAHRFEMMRNPVIRFACHFESLPPDFTILFPYTLYMTTTRLDSCTSTFFFFLLHSLISHWDEYEMMARGEKRRLSTQVHWPKARWENTRHTKNSATLLTSSDSEAPAAGLCGFSGQGRDFPRINRWFFYFAASLSSFSSRRTFSSEGIHTQTHQPLNFNEFFETWLIVAPIQPSLLSHKSF